MSEVSDTIQLIVISGKVMFLAGNLSLKAAILTAKTLDTIYLAKWKGSVSYARLRKIKGDEVQFLNVSTEEKKILHAIEKEMKQHGILYARLPDLCGGDNRTQYVISGYGQMQGISPRPFQWEIRKDQGRPDPACRLYSNRKRGSEAASRCPAGLLRRALKRKIRKKRRWTAAGRSAEDLEASAGRDEKNTGAARSGADRKSRKTSRSRTAKSTAAKAAHACHVGRPGTGAGAAEEEIICQRKSIRKKSC